MKFITQFIENWAKKRLDAKQKQEQIEKDILFKETEIPLVKLIGEPYDIERPPLDPISSRYKWNPAFIRSLIAKNIPGNTDEEIIKNWEIQEAKEKAEKLLAIKKQQYKNSTEPWVEVKSEAFNNQTNQIELELDWNQAFVNMLKSKGYSGSDEMIVNKWFRDLSAQIGKEIHAERFD